MIGLSLIRNEPIHFTLFVAHIVGYSIADTALASLISKYSTPASQGRDLAYNQAAQACARVISPLVAGLLYEMSKQSKGLPAGALPYLVGAVFPAAGVLVPLVLYTQSVDKKKRILEENRRFEAGEE
jgi:MFS family permease